MTHSSMLPLAALYVASFAAMAHADTVTSCSANGSASTNPSFSTCVYTVVNGYVQDANATGVAAYGNLGVSGQAEIRTGAIGVSSEFHGAASFTDTFTVTSAAPTTGFLVFSDSISGSSVVFGSGSFGPGLGSGLFDETNIYVFSVINPIDEIGADYIIPLGNGTTAGKIRLPYISSFASTFTISLVTDGECGAYDGTCSVSTDYLDPLLISGFTLTDALGNPVDASVTFTSGTDYDAIPDSPSPSPSPVPEPSSIALLGSGILGCIGITKWRRAF